MLVLAEEAAAGAVVAYAVELVVVMAAWARSHFQQQRRCLGLRYCSKT